MDEASRDPHAVCRRAVVDIGSVSVGLDIVQPIDGRPAGYVCLVVLGQAAGTADVAFRIDGDVRTSARAKILLTRPGQCRCL